MCIIVDDEENFRRVKHNTHTHTHTHTRHIRIYVICIPYRLEQSFHCSRDIIIIIIIIIFSYISVRAQVEPGEHAHWHSALCIARVIIIIICIYTSLRCTIFARRQIVVGYTRARFSFGPPIHLTGTKLPVCLDPRLKETIQSPQKRRRRRRRVNRELDSAALWYYIIIIVITFFFVHRLSLHGMFDVH